MPKKITIQEDQDYIDIFTFLFIVFSTILAFFVNAYYQNINPELSNRAIAQIVMISALFLRFSLSNFGLTRELKYDNHISEREASKSFIILLFGFITLSLTTYYTLKVTKLVNLSVLDGDSSEDLKEASLLISFLSISAISEEILFRLTLFPFFAKFFKLISFEFYNIDLSKVCAMIFTSLLFSVFHVGVYGLTNYSYLIAIFFNALILNLIFEYTKRITDVITIHVFNNLLSSGILLVYWNILVGGFA